jgi:hypothetical protein
MIRTLTTTLLAVAATTAAALACAGPDPAITSVHVQSVHQTGQINTYSIVGTVTNEGSAAQPGNVLQFVDIYVDGVKVDAVGIPPLHLAQSYNFRYNWRRSTDAGPGTTIIGFMLNVRSGLDCNPANNKNSVTF